MSSTDHTSVPAVTASEMSAYEKQIWKSASAHWDKRHNKLGLPNWASNAIDRTGKVAEKAVTKVANAVPDVVKQPVVKAAEAVADVALKPALEGAVKIVELVNDWALELNDPKTVEKIAGKQGIDISSFSELRDQDLKTCDRLLTGNTLKWRSFGAVEGGAMGALAMVPVAGLVISIPGDILVIQVLSTAIAARIAYSYGFDAKDPQEEEFIERLVRRSFMSQAAKAGPTVEAAKTAAALHNRVNWSSKLRADHRLAAGLEKLMKHTVPAGSRVSVQSVSKVVPVVSILIGAGMNSAILGNVAVDAQRYCQTRFLSEKYGLPMPAALVGDDEA